MKVFLPAVIPCVASALLLSTAAFGQTPPQVNQPITTTREAISATTQAQLDNPLCYIQLTNGKTVNLSKLCGSQSDNSRLAQSTYSQPPAVYNDSAIRTYDDSVYGPEG